MASSACNRRPWTSWRPAWKENAQIQAEFDRLVQEHKARIQANNDEVAKEKERFYAWRLQEAARGTKNRRIRILFCGRKPHNDRRRCGCAARFPGTRQDIST